MRERWYDRSVNDLMQLLKTDPEKGLDRREAALRLKEDGKNTINPLQKEPLRSYLWQVLSDLSALLMLAAALLALIFRRDMGAVVLLVILLVNYITAILSYIRAQRVLEDLGRRAMPTAKVMRQGKLTVIPAEKVVMGDILYLSHGDIVPCDARLLSSEDLRVFEGNLFETDKVSRKDASFLRSGALKPEEAVNMVYASTVVTGGKAVAAAVVTGEDTLVCRMGKNRPIAACHKLDAIRNLKKFSSLLGVILLVPVFVLTIVELLTGGAIIEAFLTGLTFAVAAMPELYTAFSYVVVSVGMRASLGAAREKNGRATAFIKNPLALPALGECDCLLLPLESFRVKSMTALAEVYDGRETVLAEDLTESGAERALRILRYAILSTGLYGGVRLIEKNRAGENVYTPEQQALIAAGERCRIYDKSLEERFPILDHRDRGERGSLFETTLVRYKGVDVVVLRGDAREVISCCSSFCREGRIIEMDASARSELMSVAQSMIRNNRVPVAVATKNCNSNLTHIAECQTGLTFEGYVGIEVPLLQGGAQQVKKLRAAGIDVRVYADAESEENLNVARALGIVGSEGEAVGFSQLNDMSEDLFRLNADGYKLFGGFGSTQIKYVIDVLEKDYGHRIGFQAEKLGGVFPMHAAHVGFSEEDGTKLGSPSEKNGDLRSPLWVKKNEGDGQYGCQALNHVSDVILPPHSEDGNGGINSAAAAICTARSIYRSVRLLIVYLSCTCGMRFTALLLDRVGGLISPVQMLTSGLVFDLLAVFVIAGCRPDRSPSRYHRRRKVLSSLIEILPTFAAGALAFFCSWVLSGFLISRGLLTSETRSGFCFAGLLLLQSAALFAFVRSERPPFRDFRYTPGAGIYISLLAAFLALCFCIEPVGRLFGLSFPGVAPFLISFILPLILILISLVLRAVESKRRKAATQSKTGKEGRKTEKRNMRKKG